MPHKYDHSDKNLYLLESVLGRLKFGVMPTDLVKWLENFEEHEVELALDLLRYYEYITPDELLLRIDHLLKELFQFTSKEAKLLFVPYGKFGKSGTLITYPLTHLTRYKELEKKNEFKITNDLKGELDQKSDYDYIVFIDDFVGSGNTFFKELKKNKATLEEYKYCEKLVLLCPLIMEVAERKLHRVVPNIKIISEIRYKFIDSLKSPMKLYKNQQKLVELIGKYGNSLVVGAPWEAKIPWGYKNSQSLVSFYYGAPNNNFPIIWADNKWYPLFPRQNKIKIERAKDLKKDLSYFLSTFFNEELELEKANQLISDQFDKRSKGYVKRMKNNYFLLALLYLKYLHDDKPWMCNQFICNFLGVTREELRLVYAEGKAKGYTNHRKELTSEGTQLVKEMINKRRKTSIRSTRIENMKIKKYLFLPNSFRGNR